MRIAKENPNSSDPKFSPRKQNQDCTVYTATIKPFLTYNCELYTIISVLSKTKYGE